MKQVVISSFITLVVIALIAAAYFIFQRYSIVTADPMSAIPSNTIFFVEAKNTKAFFKNLSSENLLASFVHTDSSANDKLRLLDSVLSSTNEIKKIVEENLVFISAHLTKAHHLDYLFLTNVPSSWTGDKTEHYIAEAFHLSTPVSRRVYENAAIHELEVSPGKIFSFAITKGIFIGSFTSFLIDDAIRQLKSGAPVSKSKAFSKVYQSNDNTETSLYINYIGVGEFFSSFSSDGNAGFFNSISSFGRWSKLGTAIQNSGLIFHGNTASVDTTDYLTALRGQQPQKMEMTEIFPLRTALFIHLGLTNYRNYFHHLLFNSGYFDPPDKRTQLIHAIENKFHVDLEKNLTGWIDDELALVVTEPGSTFFENNCYACIKAKNTETAMRNLLLLQNAVNTKNSSPTNAVYRQHGVGYIDLAGLAPLFYSTLFSKIEKFYFTGIGSYVVIANQPAALRSFIDDYEDNKNITSDAGFTNLLKHTERLCNYFLYVNLGRSKNIFRHYASDDFNATTDKTKKILNQFTAFTFQLANRNENFETTMQLSQGKEKIKNATLLWTAQFDTAVSTTPFIVTDSVMKKKFIVVQDDAKNLYLLDDAGNTVWKKSFPEKIIGDFHIVDGYKNGQQQILFNTSSQLYLLDLDGNNHGNYPIQLPAKATNGCEVIDFDQSKNYKIFVACSNRVIYTYEFSGKPLTGWLFNEPVSDVVNPLQNFKIKNKDYLLLYNHLGNVYMLDKNGAVRTAWKQFLIARNSSFTFIPGDSSDEEHLVTTDTSGKIITLYGNGTVKSKSFGNFSAAHVFSTTDADGDGKIDFAFLDHNQLKVFRQDSTQVFSYAFEDAVLPQLYSFSFTASQPQLGVGCLTPNKFFVLDFNGQLSHGFPVKGCRASSKSDWGNEGKKIIVTSGKDGTVCGYLID